MSKFYICSEIGCNKKYKTKDKYIGHLLTTHKIIKSENEIEEPVEITKENKKIVENERNKIKREKLVKEKMEEIHNLKKLEEKAKREAEEKFMAEQMEKYMMLEQEKLKLEEEKLRQQKEEKLLEKKWISIVGSIQNRIEKNSEDCSICVTNIANTACAPCGHKNFCYDCISSYINTYKNKGCPVCRTNISSIVKIYS